MQSGSPLQINIERMTEADWSEVCLIYLDGIATGNATFEQAAPEWEKWDAGHLKSCRFVARTRDGILGWAALSPVSARRVYSGVAEVSVYVAESARGLKIGSKLLDALIEGSEREGLWTLQAGVFPENLASIELHKRHGFRVVGVRERLGSMNGRWRDVVLMERRSTVTGL
jgi:L-amino acid N-acyltransferase YncA